MIGALERARSHGAERKRHVAMRATIEQRCGVLVCITKKHHALPEQLGRDGASRQGAAFTHDVPVINRTHAADSYCAGELPQGQRPQATIGERDAGSAERELREGVGAVRRNDAELSIVSMELGELV